MKKSPYAFSPEKAGSIPFGSSTGRRQLILEYNPVKHDSPEKRSGYGLRTTHSGNVGDI